MIFKIGTTCPQVSSTGSWLSCWWSSQMKKLRSKNDINFCARLSQAMLYLTSVSVFIFICSYICPSVPRRGAFCWLTAAVSSTVMMTDRGGIQSRRPQPFMKVGGLPRSGVTTVGGVAGIWSVLGGSKKSILVLSGQAEGQDPAVERSHAPIGPPVRRRWAGLSGISPQARPVMCSH